MAFGIAVISARLVLPSAPLKPWLQGAPPQQALGARPRKRSTPPSTPTPHLLPAPERWECGCLAHLENSVRS